MEKSIWATEAENGVEPNERINLEGIEIKVLFPGDEETRGKHPTIGDVVKVHYKAFLLGDDGERTEKPFEDSRERGRPLKFEIGRHQVISGWEHGIRTMDVGQRAQFIMHASRCYGEAGQPPVIPPSASIVFEVQLIKFRSYADYYS